jgi:hypothetical protein
MLYGTNRKASTYLRPMGNGVTDPRSKKINKSSTYICILQILLNLRHKIRVSCKQTFKELNRGGNRDLPLMAEGSVAQINVPYILVCSLHTFMWLV